MALGVRTFSRHDQRRFALRLLSTILGENMSSRLFQRVRPHLVPIDHPLAHVDGATNAVVAEGNFMGRLLFQGAGAGDGPTASAVVADIIDIARGRLLVSQENGPVAVLKLNFGSPLLAAQRSGQQHR